MDIAQKIFQKKTALPEKLTEYGFIGEDAGYVYRAALSGSGFLLTVTVTARGEVGAAVTDPVTGEPYALHLSDRAEGSFVGGVKYEYERILTEIADRCFTRDVFQTDAAKALIRYIRATYGDELEYLWEKFPDNAIARRKDNRKWYAVFLTAARRKLGIDSDGTAEILDLRMSPEEIERKTDGKIFLPGYHMNKKHWITVCLDGDVPLAEICAMIDESYRLAAKK